MIRSFVNVRRSLQSDVLKIFVYVAAALVLGAILAPWVYQLGKGLAEVTEGKQTNGLIAYVAKSAAKADFATFFNRALMLSAFVLLFPLLSWLQIGRAPGSYRDTPWSLRLPDSVVILNAGQPLQRNPRGWWQSSTGFILAAGLLLLSGWVMLQAGCFMWKDAAESTKGAINRYQMDIEWAKAFRKVIPRALAVSLIEELLFRGVLLGIFLRAMKPAPAIATLSFLFAFVHFLSPPPHALIEDPEASNAGFILLGQIFHRFADPISMASGFLMLSVVGVVLGYARYRTASLWLPVGLHAGWVFGMGIFKAATWPVGNLPETIRLFVGLNLLEGLLPLSVVLVTGILVHLMTRVDPLDEGDRV